MHIRLSADCRSIPELRGDQSDGSGDRFLARNLIRSFPELRENDRHFQCAAPRSKILGRVGKIREAPNVVVHIAGADVEPLPVFLVPEESLAGGQQEGANKIRHQRRSLVWTLLSYRSLSAVVKPYCVVVDGNV